MATLTGELAVLVDWLDEPTRHIVAHLAQNFIGDDAETIQLADLIECTFPGYAPIEIDEWDPIDFEDDLYGEAASGELEWNADDDIARQNICVAYLTIREGSGPVKLWWPVVLPIPAHVDELAKTFAFQFRVASVDLSAVATPDSGV